MTGQILLGILFLITGGFLGIGTIIDIFSYKSIANDYNRHLAYDCYHIAKMFFFPCSFGGAFCLTTEKLPDLSYIKGKRRNVKGKRFSLLTHLSPFCHVERGETSYTSSR